MATATKAAPPAGLTEWQALINLSVGRPDKQSDLVPRGGIVKLTDDQVEEIQRGRRFPVLRPAKYQNQPLPVITAQMLLGNRPAPGLTPLGDPIREDPAGSSRLEVVEQLEHLGTVSGARGMGAGSMASAAILSTPEFNDGRIQYGGQVPAPPAPSILDIAPGEPRNMGG